MDETACPLFLVHTKCTERLARWGTGAGRPALARPAAAHARAAGPGGPRCPRLDRSWRKGWPASGGGGRRGAAGRGEAAWRRAGGRGMEEIERTDDQSTLNTSERRFYGT